MGDHTFDQRFSEPELIKRDDWGSVLRVRDRECSHPRIVRRLDRDHRGRPLGRAALEAEVGYSEALGEAPCARAELVELTDECVLAYEGVGGIRLDRLLEAPQLAGYRLTQHGAIAIANDLLVTAIAVQQTKPPTSAGRHRWGHGEIVPSNILIGASGSGRLVNATFAVSGIGELAPPPLSRLCRPPEISLGHPGTAAGDVYAVGIILAASVVGPAAVLSARPPVGAAVATELSALGTRLDPRFVDAVLRSLAQNPDDRFSGPAEMLACLRKCGSVDDLRIAIARIALALERPGTGLAEIAERYPSVLTTADYAIAEAGAPTRTGVKPRAPAPAPTWEDAPIEPTRSAPGDVLGRALDQAALTANADAPTPAVGPPLDFQSNRAKTGSVTRSAPTALESGEHPAFSADDDDGPTMIGEGALLSAILSGVPRPAAADSPPVGATAVSLPSVLGSDPSGPDSIAMRAADDEDSTPTNLDLPEIGVQALDESDIARIAADDPELADAIRSVSSTSCEPSVSKARDIIDSPTSDAAPRPERLRAEEMYQDRTRTPLAMPAVEPMDASESKTPPPDLVMDWGSAFGTDEEMVASGPSSFEGDGPTEIGESVSPALKAAAEKLARHRAYGGALPEETSDPALAAVKSEPALTAEPAAKAEPAVKSEPAVTAELAVKSEPAVTAALAVKSEPTAKAEPVVKADPITAPEEIPTPPRFPPADAALMQGNLQSALFDSDELPTGAGEAIPAHDTLLGAVTVPPDQGVITDPPTVEEPTPHVLARPSSDLPPGRKMEYQRPSAPPPARPSQDPPVRFDDRFDPTEPKADKPEVIAPLLARTAVVAANATTLGLLLFTMTAPNDGTSRTTGSGLGVPPSERAAAGQPKGDDTEERRRVIFRDVPANDEPIELTERRGAVALEDPEAADRAADLLFPTETPDEEPADEEPPLIDDLSPADELPYTPTQLVINVIPWGRVFIDGEDHGFPPVLIEEAEPGVHSIRVERLGFEPVSRTVTVQEGLRKTVHIRLADR